MKSGIQAIFPLSRAPLLSVHEVGRPAAQLHLFVLLKGKLDSRQSDQQGVQSLKEEDEEEEPEASVVALGVRLEDEIPLIEVGDPLGQTTELYLRHKQDHDEAAADTCRKHRQEPSGLPLTPSPLDTTSTSEKARGGEPDATTEGVMMSSEELRR